MAVASFVAYSSPAAVTTAATVGYPTGFAVGDLLLLFVSSDSPSIGAAPAGFTAVGSTVSTAGANVAVFSKTAAGTETGTVVVPVTGGTKGLATMAAYRPPAGYGAAVVYSTGGADTNGSSTAYDVTGSACNTATDDLLVTLSLGAANGGTFSGNWSGFALSVAGATMGTGTTRVSGRTGTNTLVYNLYDRAIGSGATGAPHYTATAAGANVTGATAFIGVRVVGASTPPTSAATVPASSIANSTYTATDASSATTSGATIASRVWRIVSGGGSLSSTTGSSITVTAPASGTQVIGIVATDSNGLSGAEATYSVTINAGPQPNAGADKTVDSMSTVQLTGSGTPTPSVYQWRQVSGQSVTLSSTSSASPTFKAPASVDGLSLVFGLKVGNGSTLSAEDTVTITVSPHIEWVLEDSSWKPVLVRIM